MRLFIGLLLKCYMALASASDDQLLETVNFATDNLESSAQVNRIKCESKTISNSCPETLTRQISDASKGGLWGWFNTFSSDGDGSPISMCSSNILPRLNEMRSPIDMEKFMAIDKTTFLDISISEIHPFCVQQFKDTPDGKEKMRLLISSYYMGRKLIDDESHLYLKGIGGIDTLLGKPFIRDIACDDFVSTKTQKNCLKLKICPRANKTDSQKQLADLASDTFKIYNEIKSLERKVFETQAFNIAARIHNDPLLEQLKQTLKLKKQMYPWLEGRAFKNTINDSRSLSEKTVEKAIVAELLDTRKELSKKLNKVDQLHGCLLGTENSDVCEDYEKIVNSFSSKEKLKKEIRPKIPTVLNDKTKNEYYISKLIVEQNLHQSLCSLEKRNERDESINDMAKETAIATILGVGSFGTGYIALGVGLSARAVLGANILQKSFQGAGLLYGAHHGYNAYNLCQEELRQLKNVKANISGEFCPKIGDEQTFKLEKKYNSCLIDASAALALGAVPILSSKFLRKPQKKSVNDIETSSVINSSKFYSKEEVVKYHKMSKGHELANRAMETTGDEQSELLALAKTIREEVGDIDMLRYRQYKMEYIDTPGLAKVEKATQDEWEEAIKKIQRKKETSSEANSKIIKPHISTRQFGSQFKDFGVEEVSLDEAKKLFGKTKMTDEEILQAVSSNRFQTKKQRVEKKQIQFEQEIKSKSEEYRMIDPDNLGK